MQKTRFTQLPLAAARIEGTFWATYQNLARQVMLTYQWEALNDRIDQAEPSGAIRNFRIAAREEQGIFAGEVFQDSDLYKWIEAASYSLAIHPDQGLAEKVQSAVALIARAQCNDGYLNTYFQIAQPARRWTDLENSHELYCAGHLFEAAAARLESTGERDLAEVALRLADHIANRFGVAPGKRRGYCGHEEVELGLIRLADATGEDRLVALANYFIDERGSQPSYFKIEAGERKGANIWNGWKEASGEPNLAYTQSHQPVRQQETAVGHAVRALYLYSGMADLAARNGDAELAAACRKLFSDVTERQMYITGGVGSTAQGEAFTVDWDLPNETAYNESCASVALAFFARRMIDLERDGTYADVLERAIVNTVLAGFGQDGTSWFYSNPMEIIPSANLGNPGRRHVKAERQKWFRCACCPPNIARLLLSLGRYAFGLRPDGLDIHLYTAGSVDFTAGKTRATLTVETDWPNNGLVSASLALRGGRGRFSLAFRIPAWSRRTAITLNGEEIQPPIERGYAVIDRQWQDGDRVSLDIAMEPLFIRADPRLQAVSGKVALQRGPLVYCIEEIDNGDILSALAVDTGKKPEEYAAEGMLGTYIGLAIQGSRDTQWSAGIYAPERPVAQAVSIRAIPYCLWGNRGKGEMRVWIRERPSVSPDN